MAARDITLVIRVDDQGTRIIKQFSTSLSTGFKSAETQVKKTDTALERFIRTAKQNFMTFASGLLPTMGLVAALSKLHNEFGKLISQGIEFEDTMARMSLKMEGGAKAADELKMMMLQVSPSIASVEELARGMSLVLPAGVDSARGLEIVKQSAKLAQVGMMDMDTATRGVMDTMRMYKMSMGTVAEATKSAAEVGDIFTTMLQKSDMEGAEAVRLFQKLGATAASLGVPLTDVAAAMTTLRNQGMPTQAALMGLMQTMMFLSREPSKNVTVAMKEMGVSFDALTIRTKGLPFVINELATKLKDVAPGAEQVVGSMSALGDEVYTVGGELEGLNPKVQKLIPNMAAFRTLNLLAANGGRDLTKALNEQSVGVGALDAAWKVTEKTLKDVLLDLRNIGVNVRTQFYESFASAFIKARIGSEEFEKKFEALSKTVMAFAEGAGKAFGNIVDFLWKHRDTIKEIIILYTAWYVLVKKTFVVEMLAAMVGQGKLFNKVLYEAQFKLLQLKEPVIGLKGAISALGPALAAFFTGWKIGRWVSDWEILGTTIGDAIGSSIVGNAKIMGQEAALADSTKKVAAAVERLAEKKNDMMNLAQSFAAGTTVIQTQAEALGVLGQKYIEFGTTGSEWADRWVKIHIQQLYLMELAKAGAGGANQAMLGLLETLRRLDPAYIALEEKSRAAAAAQKAYSEEIKKWAQSAGFVTRASISEEMSKFSAALEMARSAGLSYEDSIKSLSKGIIGLGDVAVPAAEMYGIKLPAAFTKALESARAFAAAMESAGRFTTVSATDVQASVMGMGLAIQGAAEKGISFETFIKQNSSTIIDWYNSMKPLLDMFGIQLPPAIKMAVAAAEQWQERLQSHSVIVPGLTSNLLGFITMVSNVDEAMRKMASSFGLVFKTDQVRTLEEMARAMQLFSQVADPVSVQNLARSMLELSASINGISTSSAVDQFKKFYGAMQQVYAAMGTPLPNINWDLYFGKEPTEKLKQLGEAGKGAMNTIGTALNVAAGQFGETFSPAISALGSGFQSLAQTGDTSAKGIAAAFGAAAASIGGALGSAISGTKKNFSALGSELGGAVGGIFGPIGGLIGKFAGGLLGGLFKQKKTAEELAAEAAAKAAALLQVQAKEATDAMSKFGKISEATAKAIAEDRKAMSGAAAEGKNFASVIADVGVKQSNINQLFTRAVGILDSYQKGELDAATAAKSAGESFNLLVDGARRLGQEGSVAMLNFMKQTKLAGLEVKEITEYIQSKLGISAPRAMMNAAEGLAAMARRGLESMRGQGDEIKSIQDQMADLEASGMKFSMQWSDLRKKLQKLTGGPLVDGAAQDVTPTIDMEKFKSETERIERQFLATFEAMKASGAGLPEIFEALGPAVDALSERYRLSGVEASGAIAEMMKIRNITIEHRDLFDAITGNLGVLDALASTGSLTQQSFTDAAVGALEYYNQLQETGLTSNQSLAQMAPTLEKLRFLAREHGYAIDEGTQALIDQATQAGLMKQEELSLNDTLMAGFGSIIEALGGQIPKAMREAMMKMKELGEGAGEATSAFRETASAAAGIGEAARASAKAARDAFDDIAGGAEDAAASCGIAETSIKGSGIFGALEAVRDLVPNSLGLLAVQALAVADASKVAEDSTKSIVDGLGLVGLSAELAGAQIDGLSTQLSDLEGTNVGVSVAGALIAPAPPDAFGAARGEFATSKGGEGDADTSQGFAMVVERLNSLIEVVKTGLSVEIEPVVLPDKASNTTIAFVKKQYDTGNWRMPPTSIG